VDNVTTSHIWDGQSMVGEYGSSGTVSAKYLRGIRLTARQIGGTADYYNFNGHGDTTSLMSASGTITVDYKYDAFGNQAAPIQNDTNPFRYAGEYTDSETGMIYLRARYYDPSLGRFISEDPIKDGLNWYAYCGGNPVMFIDPSGLKFTFDNIDDANLFCENAITIGGYDGYYIDTLDDGTYIMLDNYNGTINGGSETFRGEMNIGIHMDNDIRIIYSDTENPRAEYLSNGVEIKDLTLFYDNKSSVVYLPTGRDDVALYTTVHEVTHSLSWNLNHFNNVIFWGDNPNKSDVIFKYMEAAAITVGNTVMNEAKMKFQDSFYRDIRYFDGVPTKVNPFTYGAFPYEYTGGNAAIITTLGENLPLYYQIEAKKNYNN